jgi:hypothetical protein
MKFSITMEVMKKLIISLMILGICSLFAQDIPQNNPPLITAVYLFPVPHHEEGLEILYSGGDTEALDVYKDGHWFQTITDDGRYVEILHIPRHIHDITYQICDYQSTTACSQIVQIRP